MLFKRFTRTISQAPIGLLPPDTSPTRERRTRNSKIHTIIQRVIEDHPSQKSSVLWDKLRQDINSEVRLYDSAYIIDRMSNTEIVWRDNTRKLCSLKRRSFQILVSKFKNDGS